MVTDLKDDDECQPGSQDMPELQSEFVWHCVPGWRSVVSVPAVSRVVSVIQLTHVKHGQAAVHVALQTPTGESRRPSRKPHRLHTGHLKCTRCF